MNLSLTAQALTDAPKFKAEGRKVMYDRTPNGVKNADGTTSYSMIVPILEVTEWLKEPHNLAVSIAKILNEHAEDFK